MVEYNKNSLPMSVTKITTSLLLTKFACVVSFYVPEPLLDLSYAFRVVLTSAIESFVCSF